MPYKKVQPADESDMRKKRYLGHHTICETLREIWRESNDPNIKEKAKMAMSYAKRMNERLKYYAKRYNEEHLLENVEEK